MTHKLQANPNYQPLHKHLYNGVYEGANLSRIALPIGGIGAGMIAIHKYNFKPSLFDHINPQRPTYALGREGGLLLCPWPKE